ncbi:alpha/beta fold hydrolase [Agrococcus sp. Ld7]|uniref:alpha/beta fold hydrolase n=1 Tax=Agrococcus sp. Ld7 TaxID=649148 RepID=UPI0038667F85
MTPPASPLAAVAGGARAALPPHDLPGLDPAWSRIVAVPGRGLDAGITREWHCLDTADALAQLGVEPAGTILAVHGNPTWSYLWRRIAAASLRRAAAGETAWRVVAVDQLEMGYSERTELADGARRHRTLAQRVADLSAFTDALGADGAASTGRAPDDAKSAGRALNGLVVTLGHDWGGVVSLGWAIDHPGQLAGVALLNTAVHHPAGTPIPAPLRLAGARGVLGAATVATSGFLDTTLALASPSLDAEVQAAFRAPYGSASRRHGIGGFVADIPVDAGHESFVELERISAGVASLRVPALLLWGPSDPVFGDRYLDDLVDRMPHADVHRFEGASHLVAEDRPYAPAVLDWLAHSPVARPIPPVEEPPQAASRDQAAPSAPHSPVEERIGEADARHETRPSHP